LRSEKVRSLLPDLHGKILVVDNADEVEGYGQLLVRLAALASEDKLPPAPLSRKQKIISLIARELVRDDQLVWDKLTSAEQQVYRGQAGGIWKRELDEIDGADEIGIANFVQFLKNYRAGKVVGNAVKNPNFPTQADKLKRWYVAWKARQRGDSTLPPQQGRGVDEGEQEEISDEEMLRLNKGYFVEMDYTVPDEWMEG